MKRSILAIEKGQKIKKILKDNLKKTDEIFSLEKTEDIINKLSLHPDLIVMAYEDYYLELLNQIIRYDSSLRVIVFSDNYNVEEAVEVIRVGAHAYLSYNDSQQKIKEVLTSIFKEEENYVNDFLRGGPWYFGSSQSTKQLLVSLNKVVQDNLDIIILGEKGVGKQTVARILHEVKNKRKKPFAFINFAKYKQEFWETQFWSSFKDYFEEYSTDVPNLKEPLYGTIYLKNLEVQDENFILSLFQLLKQRREGVQDKFAGNIRVIIGLTDQSCLKKIKLDNFHLVKIPSLKERKEEIVGLTRFFLKRFASKYHRRVEEISLNVLDFLTNYSWPANIGEMESIIRLAVLKSKKTRIDIEDLWVNMEMFKNWNINSSWRYRLSISQALANFEDNLIKTFLKKFENLEEVSRLLGIDEIELEKKMREITSF